MLRRAYIGMQMQSEKRDLKDSEKIFILRTTTSLIPSYQYWQDGHTIARLTDEALLASQEILREPMSALASVSSSNEPSKKLEIIRQNILLVAGIATRVSNFSFSLFL